MWMYIYGPYYSDISVCPSPDLIPHRGRNPVRDQRAPRSNKIFDEGSETKPAEVVRM